MYIPAWPPLNPLLVFRRPVRGCPPFPLSARSRMDFFSARYGIYQLFRTLKLRGNEFALVPDYHHGNEVRAIRAAGTPIRFYRILRNLEPDLDDIDRFSRSGARVLYVIHFIGWPQPMKELSTLCQTRGMLLFEDCALSLLSAADDTPLGSTGDWSVFCLYKTLPVPNGGVLVQNRPELSAVSTLKLRSVNAVSAASRMSDLITDWLKSRNAPFGLLLSDLKNLVGKTVSRETVKRVPLGNSGFDLEHADLGASSLINFLLKRFDYEAIRSLRRRNYLYMLEKLDGRAAVLRTDLPEGVCPLFLPLLVEDKHSAAEQLAKRGIETVEFWNEGDPQVTNGSSSESQYLRRHVLEVPIHQELTYRQMDYMASQIVRATRPQGKPASVAA